MKLDLKLKTVTLENFRLFEKLEMDFHPQLTVLIGENGAGKTALVEGIIKMLTPIPEVLIEPNLKPLQYSFDGKLYNVTDIKFGELLIKNEIKTEFAIDNKTRNISWATRHNVIEMNLLQNIALEVMQKKLSGEAVISLPAIIYYPCEKVDNEPENGQKRDYTEQDIFNAYENALNARAFDFKRFFEWFKWQEDRELRGQGSKTLNIVREAILSMLNDEGDEDKFTNIFVDVSSLDRYKLKLKKRDAELEVSQLSAGEKSLFALVSDIARRLAIANPKCEDPLKEGGGIVIIDEIDLHLHPRWQRKIVRKLTEVFPKLQFIITTHSPLILGSIRSENIRLLDDGQVYSVPETYGQNVGLIIKKIMGVEEGIFEDKIKDIFKLLANNKVAEAKGEIAVIEQASPADIPALREAKAILRRKEMPAQ